MSETSPLVANSLLALHEDPADRPVPFLNRILKLEDRVVEFLLGSDRADSRLLTPLRMARWISPKLTLEQLILSESVRKSVAAFIAIAAEDQATRCVLHGAPGAGRKAAAEGICHALNRPLFVIDLAVLLKSETSPALLFRAAIREAMLYRSALYVDGWQEILAEDRLLRLAQEELDRFHGPLFIGSNAAWQPPFPRRHHIHNLEFPTPAESQRQQLWESQLNHGTPLAADVSPAHLASAFRFTPGQIRNAFLRAQTHAVGRVPSRGETATLTIDDLFAGCRSQAVQQLGAFAHKMPAQRTWQDLVLPKDTTAQLREFCQRARQRVLVYAHWGFDRKLTLGKGLIALFSGSSGTGKTLSAEILAHELGLDLYRIDLSSVVSKYIGETEKNLSRVFAEAQESNAILFFDEADALFGKRSEVKDAHDRYANIEINYLLQRVEEFEGIIILASNLSKNIDPAFSRRLHFVIDFPFPDEEHRLRIWQGIFPREAPLAADLDFPFLARKFKIAGGNIKNIALAAAFAAADNGQKIAMPHLIAALKREYQKLGKVCEKSDFEHYYDLLRT